MLPSGVGTGFSESIAWKGWAMDENKSGKAPAGTSPLGDSENAADSATPGKKPIDDTSESSTGRREHPGLADEEDD